MTDLNPSKIKNDFWIHVTDTNHPHEWTTRSGKWLLFVHFKKLDSIWKLIAEETELGRLGIAAKAATAKPNSLAKNPFINGYLCLYL